MPHVLTCKIFGRVFKRRCDGFGKSLQTLLIENKDVWEHITTRGGQQVDFLQTNQFVVIELLFGLFYFGLHVFEFVQLRIGVRIKFLGNVFHPVQSSPVVCAGIFHAFHVALSVLHSSQTKRFYFL